MRTLLACTLLPAALLAGCSGGSSDAGAPAGSAVQPGPRTVTIRDFEFAPAELTVAKGTKVTWVNTDRAPHTATGDGFDTGTINGGRRRSVTFDQPGTFTYLCQFHPFMKGTVTVR